MPNNSSPVAVEVAACGIAPAAWTEKVDAGASQVQVGVVVHAVAASCPKGEGVVAVGPDVAVDDDGAGGSSEESHLMGGGFFDSRSVVVVYGQSADDAIVGTFLQHDDAVAYGFAAILF